MSVTTVETRPIEGQKPGTSGLRKKTRQFMEPGYLENFVQAMLDVADVAGKTIVLGGEGRFFNTQAAQTILRIAAANGVERVIIGQDGLLSTPAASALIRAARRRVGSCSRPATIQAARRVISESNTTSQMAARHPRR